MSLLTVGVIVVGRTSTIADLGKQQVNAERQRLVVEVSLYRNAMQKNDAAMTKQHHTPSMHETTGNDVM